MKISERIALLKAGYTKEEIASFQEEEGVEITEQPKSEPEQKSEDFMNVVTALAEEVRGMKKAMQSQNISNTKIESDDQMSNVDRILQSIINPIDANTKEVN